MLLVKPEGMCTVSSDLESRTVTLGFLEPKFAQSFRNHVVDKVIDENQGKKREPIIVGYNLDELDPQIIERWRTAFESHFKGLDFSMRKDAWQRDTYVRDEVQRLWDGWVSHALYMKANSAISALQSVPVQRFKEKEGVITACPSSM